MNGLDQVVYCPRTVTNSYWSKRVQKAKIKVIYNGIAGEENDEVDPQVEAELLEYKNKGYKIIGCIGTLCEKGKPTAFAWCDKSIRKRS